MVKWMELSFYQEQILLDKERTSVLNELGYKVIPFGTKK
jgi:very-short-patch-repair endonuclease